MTTYTHNSSSDCPCPVPAKRKTPFQLHVKAGVGFGPTVGLHTYNNLVLKDALDINVINVNNTPETALKLQFTFDSSVPLLSRYQADGVTKNLWQSGDVLVINYNKYV